MDVQKEYKELFSQNKHLEAIELLKSSNQSFDPAVFHYNIGVNFAKLENYPMARLHLEKSLALGFRSPESLNSLAHVKEALGVGTLERKSSAKDYILDFTLEANTISGLNLSLLLLLLVLVKLKSFNKRWIQALLLAISLVPIATQLYVKNQYESAVSTKKINVLRGPSSIFEQVQELPEGMKFIISKGEGDWVFVHVPQSHRGWIKNQGFVKL